MIITCKECNTSYNLNESQLQPSGTKVRCTTCKHVFTAFPPADEAPVMVKAEPVAETPPTQAFADQSTDELSILDSDDIIEIDEDEAFDLESEDFQLPGNDLAFAQEKKSEPSEEDLVLTDEDLDLVMDMAPTTSKEALTTSDDDVTLGDDVAVSGVAVSDGVATGDQASLDEGIAPDLGELDDLLDDIPEETLNASPDATVDAEDNLELEDLDFDLGDDDSAVEAFEKAPELDGADELDLDLDLDLDLGDDEALVAGDDTPAGTEVAFEDALSLGDDLTIEDTDDVELPEADDLELEDLDLELDLTSDGEAGGEPELAMGFEEEALGAGATDQADDDLGLELDFDMEEDQAEDDALLDLDLGADDESAPDLGGVADLGGNDDLSLDLGNLDLMDDDTSEDSNTPEEALELDLGGGLELTDDASGEEDDLDLSDLGGLLDETETAKDGGPDSGGLELEESSLFGDDDLGLGDGKDEAFDLSEFENILDDEDDGAAAGFSLEEEPELDLDLESPLTSSGDDESLDLSDFEYLAEDGETAPSDDRFDGGDMELEFQVDEEGVSALEEADAEFTPSKEPEDLPAEPEIVPDAVAAPMAPAGPAPVPKKRGISKLLIVFLIIVLLLGGGYCAYVLLDGMGIRIPYVSDYLKPEANDPGNLQMTTFDINSRFVDSQVLGRIFVITGKVKNGYDHPRGFVQLTGKLFTKGKNLSSSETVYAGNLISDMDLVNLSAEELKKRLNNRFGNNRMNSRVQPGKALPFMVVFSTLPEDQLEEFTIEVDTSTALK
jgi:predicted Zn finger-like uncharacterized protein